MEKDELVLLGRIDGKIDGISAHLGRLDGRIDQLEGRTAERFDQLEERTTERFDSIDKRLRVVEQKAAVVGAVSGSAVSIGIALAIEGVKQWLSRGGTGQ